MDRSREFIPSIALAAIGLILLLPGGAASASSITLDGAWTSLDPSVSPPSARREYAAVHDFQRNRYILFGGFGFGAPDPGGLFMEVWTLSLDSNPTWTTLDIDGPSPGERHSPQ